MILGRHTEDALQPTFVLLIRLCIKVLLMHADAGCV